MKSIKTKGIVLKTFSYSESSCITKIFTKDYGVISCLVRGAKKSTAKVRKPYLNELSILDLVLKTSAKSDLYYISEVKFDYNYSFINSADKDLTRNCIFMLINEFLLNIINDASSTDELFDFIYDALIELDTAKEISPDFHIIFITKIMYFLGINISFENYEKGKIIDIRDGELKFQTETEDALNVFNPYIIPCEFVEIISQANHKNTNLNDRLDCCKSGKVRRATADYILKFYQYYYPNIKDLKSLDILKELFS
ncbi:MAG: DNA repair protein RecO [Bacteroidales bacterium]